MADPLFNRYKVLEGWWMSVLGAFMQSKAPMRTNVLGFLGLVGLSSALMLWLFWHFPRGTGAFTLVVLAAFGISARLARWIDSEGLGSEARRLLADPEGGESG